MLASLSLRDRAAQLVWPWVLGDYVPEGSAEWARIRRLVTEQHVGGFIVSVGSPIDIAAKLNALQRPERPAAARQRGPRDGGRVPGARRLLPAERDRPRRRDAIPAGRWRSARCSDTALAYEHGEGHRARGARARHSRRIRAGARREQQPGESGDRRAHRSAEDPALTGAPGRCIRARAAGARHARDRETLPRSRRHGDEFSPRAGDGERVARTTGFGGTRAVPRGDPRRVSARS